MGMKGVFLAVNFNFFFLCKDALIVAPLELLDMNELFDLYLF